MSLNICTFIGRLGNQAEVKTLESGKKVANFSIAVDQGYGDNKKTIWVNLVAWEKIAGVVEKYTNKGTQIAVECEYSPRSWEKDGKKNWTHEFRVSNLVLLGSPGNSSSNQSSDKLPWE